MNILIVSYFDDNYGDMLIRICFKNILKVVLKNLNITNYKINYMSLKEIDEYQIKKTNQIFFAGGGLFGLSYLNFFEYLNKIIDLAEKNNIPVIFSSIGINNMDASKETEHMLIELLNNKCIKSISVRENKELFKYYLNDNSLNINEVCDPVVWAKHIYHIKNKINNKKIIGINVVRGGLFKDNKKNWNLKDEMEYLNSLKKVLDDTEYDYRFYTNGSVLDNNTLRYFAKKYKIQEDKLIYINSSKELIETINEFDFVVAIRMHSSIISYALEIPSVNLVWNEKISYFYKNINHENFAISIDEWNANKIYKIINEYIYTKKYNYDKKYLMSLYDYLFNTLKTSLNKKNINSYTFKQIKNILEKEEITIEEDIIDYKCKLAKAEKLYLARFTEVKKQEKELKKINEKYYKLDEKKEMEIQQKEDQITNLNQKINNLIKEIEQKDKKIKKYKLAIQNKNKIINEQQINLDKINNRLMVKMTRTIKQFFSKNKNN